MAAFIEMLRSRWQKANSMVCVGLDSDLAQIPESARTGSIIRETMKGFNKSIVSMTQEHVCAYKPNVAFYEGEGNEGWLALGDTFDFVREVAPDIPIILDAKRTDIGNTNKGYLRMAFGVLDADAITVNPYFGGEALKPFLDRADKGVVVLCKTSNPGAGEFQDLVVSLDIFPKDTREFFQGLWPATTLTAIRMYEYVAYRAVKEWNKNGNVLLVVGATYPEELRRVRRIVGDMPILVPGIGAQQGDLEATVKAGLDSTGFGMMINSSRGIIFAKSPGDEAKKLQSQINAVKATITLPPPA